LRRACEEDCSGITEIGISKVSTEPKKEKCPDCEYCQMCSETRCRVCREEGLKKKACELGSSFTYEEYLKWKSRKCR
jgi:hypothetical protein